MENGSGWEEWVFFGHGHSPDGSDLAHSCKWALGDPTPANAPHITLIALAYLRTGPVAGPCTALLSTRIMRTEGSCSQQSHLDSLTELHSSRRPFNSVSTYPERPTQRHIRATSMHKHSALNLCLEYQKHILTTNSKRVLGPMLPSHADRVLAEEEVGERHVAEIRQKRRRERAEVESRTWLAQKGSEQ
jgi:hypothetical protein